MTSPDPAALDAATAIAAQLADPRAVSAGPGSGRDRPQCLAGGAAGIALLHVERARSGHGDPSAARAWLAAAARDPVSAGPNTSLYFGVPALAFAASAAAGPTGMYRNALTALDDSAVTITWQRLRGARLRIRARHRPALAEFDLIRGLAGLGAYHLHRHPDAPVTRAVLSYLVALTRPLPGHPDAVPGWWTDTGPSGVTSPEFPAGHANAGMSHGISSCLSLMAISMRHGVTVAGQADAISRICTWIDRVEQRSPAGTWWPGISTGEPAREAPAARSAPQRPSWCYGTPAIARSLQLTALATGDATRRRTAENAMLACLRDQEQLDQLTEPGLCHGTAGLLQAAWRMAADAATPGIGRQLPGLAARLLAQLAQDPPPSAELLDGAAGIALALHTTGTGAPPASGWDRCLMLA
jgi:hypothetical protein